MILNLLRGEDLTVEEMMRRSFAEHRAAAAAPAAAAAAAAARARAAALDAEPWPPHWPSRADVQAYAAAGDALVAASPGVADAAGVVAALAPGRLTRAATAPGNTARPALVLGSRSGPSGAREVILLSLLQPDEGLEEEVAAAVAAAETPAAPAALAGLRLAGKASRPPAAPAGPGPLPRAGAAGGVRYLRHAVPLAAVDAVLAGDRVRVDADAATAAAADSSTPPPALAAAALVLARAAECLPPVLDPVADLGVTAFEAAGAAAARRAAAAARASSPAALSPHLPPALARVRAVAAATAAATGAAAAASHSALAALPEYGARLVVLRGLGYIDASDAVLTKGRVACEINAGDELVSTEAVFGGAFAALTPADAAALLSSFVFQERTDAAETPPTVALADALDLVRDLAVAAGAAQARAGLAVDPAEFAAATVRPGLAAAVHAWASGAPFADVVAMTDVMEGSIVRAVMRVDEVGRGGRRWGSGWRAFAPPHPRARHPLPPGRARNAGRGARDGRHRPLAVDGGRVGGGAPRRRLCRVPVRGVRGERGWVCAGWPECDYRAGGRLRGRGSARCAGSTPSSAHSPRRPAHVRARPSPALRVACVTRCAGIGRPAGRSPPRASTPVRPHSHAPPPLDSRLLRPRIERHPSRRLSEKVRTGERRVAGARGRARAKALPCAHARRAPLRPSRRPVSAFDVVTRRPAAALAVGRLDARPRPTPCSSPSPSPRRDAARPRPTCRGGRRAPLFSCVRDVRDGAGALVRRPGGRPGRHVAGRAQKSGRRPRASVRRHQVQHRRRPAAQGARGGGGRDGDGRQVGRHRRRGRVTRRHVGRQRPRRCPGDGDASGAVVRRRARVAGACGGVAVASGRPCAAAAAAAAVRPQIDRARRRAGCRVWRGW